jgi:hypothetical protein
MSSHKKRAKGSCDSGNSKKARGDEASDTHDFLKDGLDNKEITDLVQDIMKIIHDNKCLVAPHSPLSHASVVHNITEDDKFKFFIERYPMLFDMVTKETGFDYSFFEYFLSKRETIIKKKETSEEVHKQVGQEMFDLYYKKT